MYRMTHDELAGEATCATLEQFDLVHAPSGWRLVVDGDGEPVEVYEPSPTAHERPLPITPAPAERPTVVDDSADTGEPAGEVGATGVVVDGEPAADKPAGKRAGRQSRS